MEPYTLDTAYAAIREYFSRPDARLAVNAAGDCVYRDEDGAKCAAGCLIPDELYRPEFERKNFLTILGVDGYPELHRLLSPVRKFVARAQNLHDNSPDLGMFLFGLDALYEQMKKPEAS